MTDAENCLQSQAAALAWTAPEEVALLHFRKGWCTLAGAVATQSNGRFLAAAAEFDAAVTAWPARLRKPVKNSPPEPVSSGLRALAAIARLQADTGSGQELAQAMESPACASNLMPPDFCTRILQTGREWRGWMALRDVQLNDAAKFFAASTDTGWTQWVQGRQAFEKAAYAAAVSEYTHAIEIWKAAWQEPPLLRALAPRPALPVALADLGGAQLLAGDPAAAIRTLDAAIKADPSQAHPIFVRARARELTGQSDAALTDYNLASRTAFAAAQDLASGEAHLYRGILLYRRKDFARAEDEFSSALNFEIAPALRGDASAWRHLAAVAGGSCGSAREFLGDSMVHVSPFFPKEEARSLAAACGATAQR